MTNNVRAGSDFHQEQFADYYSEIKIIELCLNLHHNDCTFESCVAGLQVFKVKNYNESTTDLFSTS